MLSSILLVLGLSTSGVLSSGFGQCPTPKVHPDFDLEKFSGTWYLIEATASMERVTRKCSNFVIEKKQGSKASLLHKFISTITDTEKSEYSDISTPKSKEPAKLLVTPLKGTVLAKKWDLWVIDTDYETYAVLYSCKKLMFVYAEEVFIVARSNTLDDKKKTDIYDTLKKRDISQQSLVEVKQSDKDCKGKGKE